MDCRETRRTLWPADILRVSDTAVSSALAHAERCRDCRRFLEQDRLMAQLIRDSVPRVSAPRELRERLYTALARERTSRSLWHSGDRRARALSAALVVVVGVVAGTTGHWLLERRGDSAAAATFAEDYLRRAVEQDALESADRGEIASFFTRELGASIPPPEVPGYEPARATICLMNGRRGAVVEYAAGGTRFSHYVIPRLTDGIAGAADGNARLVNGPPVWRPALGRDRGLGVATWLDAEHQHALVGDLPVSELERLAPLFRCPPSRL